MTLHTLDLLILADMLIIAVCLAVLLDDPAPAQFFVMSASVLDIVIGPTVRTDHALPGAAAMPRHRRSLFHPPEGEKPIAHVCTRPMWIGRGLKRFSSEGKAV